MKKGKVFKWILSLGILGLTGFFIFVLVKTKPEAAKKIVEEVFPEVEVTSVEPETLAISIPSQGMINPRRRTLLASEVMGKIIEVSPKFDAGKAFEKGEVMLKIEDADYRAALADTQVALADAELTLATEEAQAEQAKRDFQSLGRSGSPSDLTLRKPQLAAAQVKIESAKEKVEKAKRDLERTTIRAPYEAVIASVETELGSYVNAGAPIAEIYTPAPFEVRLPISLDEMRFIQRDDNGEPSGDVLILTKAGNETHEWTGRIVRSEGQIEPSSRSIYLIAEVGVGNSTPTDTIQMQPGLFVQAALQGRAMEGLTRVPFGAFLDLDQVVVVDPDDTLRYRTVEVVRRERDDALIAGGLEPTDRIVLTELSGRMPGMKVKTLPVDAPDPKASALTRAEKP